MDLCLHKWSCGPVLSMSKYDMVRYHQAEQKIIKHEKNNSLIRTRRMWQVQNDEHIA